MFVRFFTNVLLTLLVTSEVVIGGARGAVAPPIIGLIISKRDQNVALAPPKIGPRVGLAPPIWRP